MNTLKNKLKGNFSQIPNELILDSNLDDSPYRIVCYLFSLPDGWKVNNTDIQKRFKIKTRDTMGRYWKNILASGWVTRTAKRSKTGKLSGGFEYEVHSSPVNLCLDDPDTGDRCTGKPCPVDTDIGKTQTHNNTDLSNNTDTKQQQKVPPDLGDVTQYILDNGFQIHCPPIHFFQYYEDRKWLVGKGKTEKKMTSWKLAVCNWVDRSKKWKGSSGKNGKPSCGQSTFASTPGLLDD